MGDRLAARRALHAEYLHFVKRLAQRHAQDIDLVALYGSYHNGTDTAFSDVDCYFVPRNEAGQAMAFTAILQGVGYDLFPLSWQRLEAMAALQTGMLPLLGNVRLLYCRDEAVRRRFEALQAQLHRHLLDADHAQKAAAAALDAIGDSIAQLQQTLDAGMLRLQAGQLAAQLTNIVLLWHQSYLQGGQKMACTQLAGIAGLPRAIRQAYKAVAYSPKPNECAQAAWRMAAAAAQHMGRPMPSAAVTGRGAQPVQPTQKADAAALAALYQEIASTFNKIFVFCRAGDVVNAFFAAVSLQQDLCYAQTLGAPGLDVLGRWTPQNLAAFAQHACAVRRALVQTILAAGGTICQYQTVDALAHDLL